MTLHVRENGAPGAPSIVFLHAAGTSGWMWRELADRMPDYHCLVPDLPGHGASNAMPWRDLADTAAQIAELIRGRASAGRAHIVGLSLGAYVAMQILIDHPGCAERAVVSGLTAFPLPGAGLMSAMGYALAPFIKTDAFIRANAKALRVPAASYEEYRQGVKAMSRRAFLRAGRDAAAFRLPPDAARIGAPLLAVAGEREHALMFKTQAALVAALPRAEARIAPGVGHGWNGENPELFAATVRAWLEGRPLPAALLPLPAGVAPALG